MPIQLINAGIIGMAFTMGLLSLLYGLTVRQWKVVGLYTLFSLGVMFYTWCMIVIGGESDPTRQNAYYHLSNYPVLALFGILPLLYRQLHNQKPGRVEYLFLGLYAVLFFALFFVPGGLSWQPITTSHIRDMGWLGCPYQPVQHPSLLIYPLYSIHMLMVAQCCQIAWLAHKRHKGQQTSMWILPVMMAVLVPLNAGALLGWWASPLAINPLIVTFLYIGLGINIINHFNELQHEKEILAQHVFEQEAILSASESRFHQLFDSAADALCLFDASGRMRDVNLAACDSLGYSRQELLALSMWDIEAYANEKTFQDRWKQMHQGTGLSMEVIYRRKNGSTFPVDLRILPFKHQTQPLLFASARDISLRKAEELKRHNLEEQLRQSSKLEAIGRLAGGIAHDFKNLLTAMSASLDLARWDLNPTSGATKSLDNISKAIQRASALVQQLLAFSRRQVMETQVVSLNDLLSGLGEIFKRCLGKDIVLHMEMCPHNLPVRLDPGQFEQIIMNLVVNANDAMPNGGYLVIKTAQTILQPGSPLTHSAGLTSGIYVCLTVSDSGEGMSPDVIEHIFEPFFTTKPKHKGTGLGLAMVFGSLQQLGGTILVDSAPGRGTVFRIFLPVARETIQSNNVIHIHAPTNPQGSGETILMVEDEEEVRVAGIKLLERMGYKVLSASCGNDALKRYGAHEGTIHLLMTDVVMPGIDGKELAERWLALHPHTPVLFVSGYTDNILGDPTRFTSKVHFLEKPYSRDSLAKKLKEMLEDASLLVNS